MALSCLSLLLLSFRIRVADYDYDSTVLVGIQTGSVDKCACSLHFLFLYSH